MSAKCEIVCTLCYSRKPFTKTYTRLYVYWIFPEHLLTLSLFTSHLQLESPNLARRFSRETVITQLAIYGYWEYVDAFYFYYPFNCGQWRRVNLSSYNFSFDFFWIANCSVMNFLARDIGRSARMIHLITGSDRYSINYKYISTCSWYGSVITISFTIFQVCDDAFIALYLYYSSLSLASLFFSIFFIIIFEMHSLELLTFFYRYINAFLVFSIKREERLFFFF